MWVVFRKSDKEVVGTSAHSKADVKKDVAIRQVVKGLVKGGAIADFDAIQVTDEAEALALFETGPEREIVIEVAEDGTSRPAVKERETFSLALQTDVTERHPVDGVALIAADGTSTATISVQKVDRLAQPVTRAEDHDELWLRTDHGTILDAGRNAIRSLSLAKGAASFQLQSETARRVATVQVLSADPNVQGAAIRIEFV